MTSGTDSAARAPSGPGRYCPPLLSFALLLGLGACTSTGLKNASADLAPEAATAAAEVPAKADVAAASPKIGKPYKVAGKTYTPKASPNYDAIGIASWYGPRFDGRMTAGGETFESLALSAAHPTLPLPSYVRVTNLLNQRSIVVRVNDRGPFAKGRLIDVSERTAELLDFKGKGMARVRVQYAGAAPVEGDDDAFLLASYRGPGMLPTAPSGGSANVMVAYADQVRPTPAPEARPEPAVAARAPDAPTAVA
ncbi:septal ring lytic transglycosylase RlpA family protein, partial [Propylenella binzhouense]|uniref:septal ring lytic transglycosylase RlpA family protein n=1 Tax=Propylenella binzhouense TaxID=2555902 RepID=UPI001FE786BF